MRPSAGINAYPAPHASAGDAHGRNDILAVLSQLLDLPAVAVPIPRFEPALAGAKGRVVTKDEGVALLQRIPPDGRIERAEPGIGVVLKALEVSADDLDVLPRHPPPSMSRPARPDDERLGGRRPRAVNAHRRQNGGRWGRETACP